MPIHLSPRLADQVYDALVDEICDGRLASGAHLAQEQLAERLGVSRQPVQQAMTRLKADGIIEERGRRGLFVTRLDRGPMLQHYGVRAALDGYAARVVAERAMADRPFAVAIEREGRAILQAGNQAAAAGAVTEQIRLDQALHRMIYTRSGNPMIETTAEPHWRFLRRAMGDVLRQAAWPREIWQQHAAILDALVAGNAQQAEGLALAHVQTAAGVLAELLGEGIEEDRPAPGLHMATGRRTPNR